MAITSLDERTALIVVDLQKGILALAASQGIVVDDIVARVGALASVFRARGLPVVLVNVAGAAPGRTERPRPTGPMPDDWTELCGELGRTADDICVTKHGWGAFTGTGLAEVLRERGVTQVVVCGVATSIGVESTARQAHELGFHVTIASDAVADMNAAAHANSLEHIFPRLGETGPSEAIVATLLPAQSGERSPC